MLRQRNTNSHARPDPGGHTLQCVALLASLKTKTRCQLERHCKWRGYAAHERIIDHQSNSADVYFVIRGRVQIVNFSANGREVVFEDIGMGGHFGELAALDCRPRSANVIADTDAFVASISPKVFSTLIMNHPDVAVLVMRRLSEIVRRADSRIMDLSTLAAHHRIHAELLRMVQENAVESRSPVIRPVPTQAEIASRVGAARETVARVLGDLERDGVIERKDRTLRIRDLARLTRMVEDGKGGPAGRAN